MRERRLYRPRAVDTLYALAGREINYRPPADDVPTSDEGWHVDSLRWPLAREPSGDPVRGGAWDIACRLVRDYQFAEPGILRAVYRTDRPLLGRDMLLEGRFAGLRFDLGVRITSVVDTVQRSGGTESRAWGWAYRTLQGHLEQGQLTYEVLKDRRTGAVDFRISGYSRRAPIANPVVRAGFAAFGNRTQHRFYHASARRLQRLVQAELLGAPALTAEPLPGYGDVVLAPAAAETSGNGSGRKGG